MNTLKGAIDAVVEAQEQSKKPLAVMLAGHNGSGKSTAWYQTLAPRLQIPLINADRMMLSTLPEPDRAGANKGFIPTWAQTLRDNDRSWMNVAQSGVQQFVKLATAEGLPFATETVFSHWKSRGDGTHESKVDNIIELQQAGYFVLLLFVGLANAGLSVGRVQTRVSIGGHDVPIDKLLERFPRTQQAIRAALPRADAAVLLDNSRTTDKAFTIGAVFLAGNLQYDCREAKSTVPPEISAWLDVVVPRA